MCQLHELHFWISKGQMCHHLILGHFLIGIFDNHFCEFFRLSIWSLIDFGYSWYNIIKPITISVKLSGIEIKIETQINPKGHKAKIQTSSQKCEIGDKFWLDVPAKH